MKWNVVTEIGVKLSGVLSLVLFNGFFVAAELALIRIRDSQLEPLVVQGHRRALRARHIIRNINAYIGATQFGITLASMALGVAVEPVFEHLLQPLFGGLKITSPKAQHTTAIAVGFFVNSYLLIVAGELAPKALAIRKTLSTALWVAGPLDAFYRISYPFIWLLNSSAQWLLRGLGLSAPGEGRDDHSADELRFLLSSAQNISGASTLGRDVALNALDLRRRVARDVMRPRQEIAVLDTAATIAGCLEVAEKTRYSRFPLCENGDPDKTLGVLHIKDLYAMRRLARTGADLLPAARKLIYIPETARLEKVLQLFLDRKLHLGIVVDEYGGTLGLVTLENILEELVGQIQDEFDQEKPLLVRLGENTWEAAGALPVREFEELVGGAHGEEGVATVSGWVTQRLGGFPRAGDTLRVGRCEVQVEQMDGPRVARLKISLLSTDPAGSTLQS